MADPDKEKRFYLMRIEDLGEQLQRYQLEHEELKKQNQVLTSQHSSLEEQPMIDTEVLNRPVAAKEKELEELAAQMDSLQEEARQQMEALELQHHLKMEELQTSVTAVESEISALAARSEEQLMQQQQKQEEVKELKQQLLRQREEYDKEAEPQTVICSLSLQIDELDMTVNKLKAQRAARTEKRQSVQTLSMKLQKETDDLTDRCSVIFDEIVNKVKERYEAMEERTFLEQKVTRLIMKSQQLQRELKDVSDAVILLREEKKKKLSFRRLSLDAASEQQRVKAAEASELEQKLRQELQQQRRERRQLEVTVQEASVILGHILTSFDNSYETQWKIQRLARILEEDPRRNPTLDESAKNRPDPDPKPHRKM